ncbi:MAG: hypothetical protein HY606_13335 [Planctomycetes bacterium]|nr:hypothetical protein [Planctomycetota bacterium]
MKNRTKTIIIITASILTSATVILVYYSIFLTTLDRLCEADQVTIIPGLLQLQLAPGGLVDPKSSWVLDEPPTQIHDKDKINEIIKTIKSIYGYYFPIKSNCTCTYISYIEFKKENNPLGKVYFTPNCVKLPSGDKLHSDNLFKYLITLGKIFR